MPATSDAPADGRERRKLATRRALRRAALELGLDRGLSDVPVEEIAQHAGVSPRTFFNYFDTKEDAALIELFRLTEEDLAGFSRGGPADRAWHDLAELFLADVARVEHEGRDLPRYMALHDRDPHLQARQQGRFVAVVQRLTRAVEERLGDTPDSQLRAGVMAGSCLTAVRVGLGQWVRSGWEGSARSHVAAAFAEFDGVFGESG